MENGIKGEAPKKFPYPIFGNCLPQIDVFCDNGYTKEEMKMVNETKKILGDQSIRVTATTVRVPVYDGHSESINLEFEKPFDLEELKAQLAAAPASSCRTTLPTRSTPWLSRLRIKTKSLWAASAGTTLWKTA